MDLAKQINKSFKSLLVLLKKSLDIIKKGWKSLLLTSLFSAVFVTFILIILAVIFMSLSVSSDLFYFTIIWYIITTIIFIVVSAIVQFLILSSLINPHLKFRQHLAALKKNYGQFLMLTISIDIFFLICSLPIFIHTFLFIFNVPVLGLISLFVGYLSIIALTVLILFSPFILIEKNENFINSLKKSYHLAKTNFVDILIKLIILSLILILLNWSTQLFNQFNPWANNFLNLLVFIIMGILLFSIPLAIYNQLKSNQNAG